MKCVNCGKEWENDEPLFECAKRLMQHLRDMDVPLHRYRNSTLWMIEAVVGCCDEPNLTWIEKKGEEDDDKPDVV